MRPFSSSSILGHTLWMCSLWNGDFCVFSPGVQITEPQMLVLMCAAEMMEITSAVWSAPLGNGRGESGHFFVFFFVFIFIFSPFFMELVAGEENAVWTVLLLGHWSSSVWIHGLYQKLVFQTWIKDIRDNNKGFLGLSLTWHFIWNEEGEFGMLGDHSRHPERPIKCGLGRNQESQRPSDLGGKAPVP